MAFLDAATHIHLIGIGGTGLSAIALYLIESGIKVTGSDRHYSPLAERVKAAGGKVYTGHDADQVHGADLVIRSSAIPDDNEEVIAAQAVGIPVMKRSEFMGMLMEGLQGIAIAGTHGKTTTTAMIAWILCTLNQDPSYIIGGVALNLGTNAHAGSGPQFVIEADEYDHMFLGLRPEIEVVTTVEYDHPDCFPTPEDFHQAFVEFVRQLSPEGILVVCSDDRNTLTLRDEAKEQENLTFSYGLNLLPDQTKPDFLGKNLELQENGAYAFEVETRDNDAINVNLLVPGRHNVLNSLAAFAVTQNLGLPPAEIAQSIGEFSGVSRRFQLFGETAGIAFIDDYAHHPTEIRATLSAARERFSGKDLWAVWQPHTYSRTSLFFDEFANSFEDADHVIITKVYAARESNRQGSFEDQLVIAMNHPDAHYIPGLEQASAYLLTHLLSESVVIVLSAGDAQEITSHVFEDLTRRKTTPDV